ncbi:ankyrin repeat domain-containing protein 65-like [Brachypodium distachyon]|uniref:ankyrin repeat domain-containing protein 65-like n=1 Tax=Brachypodium distachyon TaxID=15368 RepID=UPI0001C74DE4|nr:ankyrin repeat domain-containing protein 65-like [Brachypodium distachyon]|eukprot:XP_003561632.1 ankyrin repeat domain-containing protein 65-like [Brachypodium distachyon]
MDRLVIPEPSNEVVVRVEPGRPARGELTLRNAMHTMPVAFRLQPAVRGRFAVRPHTGILAPLAAVTVEVLYLASAAPEGPGGGRGEDSFLLHSVVAPGAAVREPVSALDSVNPEWFSARKKQVFVDSGIRACFVGATVAARLVAAGAVEALREVLDRSDPSWRAADAAVDESGSTLLDLAVGLGRADIVQVLLEYGADADKPSRGRTPLENAAASGECLIAELLLANGATPAGSDALHEAAAAGHSDVLKLLLGKQQQPASAASPTSSSSASFSGSFASIDAAGRDGKTALRLAAEAGCRDAVKSLLAAGARADARCGADGGTALHAAARRGDEAVARLILAHGPAGTASVRDAKGKTAYETAAEEGHNGRIMDYLGLGEAILAAARKGEARAVRRAADGGASVEGRDAHGWTPLMRAAFKGRADTVRDLIGRGADLEASDAEGYTALHCAAEAGRADVVDILLKSGANAKATTMKGRTAAASAAVAGKSKVVRLLEKAGGAGRKDFGAKAAAPVVGKGGSMDRRRRARKGSSGAIRFGGGGKEGYEAATLTVGWSH